MKPCKDKRLLRFCAKEELRKLLAYEKQSIHQRSYTTGQPVMSQCAEPNLEDLMAYIQQQASAQPKPE